MQSMYGHVLTVCVCSIASATVAWLPRILGPAQSSVYDVIRYRGDEEIPWEEQLLFAGTFPLLSVYRQISFEIIFNVSV